MIDINALSVNYGPIVALRNISLHIPTGQAVLITGPSGCGKSTLAHALVGLIPHAIPATMSGKLQVNALETQQHDIPTLAQQIGIVMQNPSAQLFHLRVADDVAFGPRNLGLTEQEVQERVEWALNAVGVGSLSNRNSAELSGGQKQLVAIAASLAMRPSILVLDEPTASLDISGTANLVTTLRNLRREYGMTILIIEHRLAEVSRLAERVIIMNEGQIVKDGRVTDTLAQREIWHTFGLRRPLGEAPIAWERLLQPNDTPPTGKSPLLEMRQLSAGYNGSRVVYDVNLALYPGEFIALVGENGAGKSTLALVAAGLLKPATGSLCFAGGKRPRPGLDVSLLFQDPTEQLFTDSVDEEVAFGPHNYCCFDCDSHEQTLVTADLTAVRVRPPLALSMGQQQRTALAACLALRPKLLILDEPTLGQDWGHLQRLMAFLTDLNKQGITIWLITHDYKLVHHYAHRVLLIENGRITLDGQLLIEEEER
jgi:energy-coupling factor transport system ATP-binding protein